MPIKNSQLVAFKVPICHPPASLPQPLPSCCHPRALPGHLPPQPRISRHPSPSSPFVSSLLPREVKGTVKISYHSKSPRSLPLTSPSAGPSKFVLAIQCTPQHLIFSLKHCSKAHINDYKKYLAPLSVSTAMSSRSWSHPTWDWFMPWQEIFNKRIHV